MGTRKSTPADFEARLRTAALSLGDVTEGVACAGTKLESRTYQVKKKTFLFVGAGVARLKLGASLEQATARARHDPAHVEAGSGGWVTLRFTIDTVPQIPELESWVAESHAGYASARPKAAPKKATPTRAATPPRKRG